MPEIPDEAVRLAMAARAHALLDDPDPMVLSDEALTRQMLEAAAPVLAEAVAKAILSHADERWPRAAFAGSAQRRLFQAAARVAAGAFTTEAESKRMAAEALAAGQYVACPLPEDGDPT